MEKKLTKQVCEEFNDMLREENSVVRLQSFFDGTAQFTFAEDIYVNPRCMLYASQTFVDKLTQFLQDKGISNIRYSEDYSMVFTD